MPEILLQNQHGQAALPTETRLPLPDKQRRREPPQHIQDQSRQAHIEMVESGEPGMKTKKHWHYCEHPDKSRRLRLTHEILARGGWVTTKAIQRHSGSTRPASDCSELRHNGADILSRYSHTDARTGNKIYLNRMLRPAQAFSNSEKPNK
jgi:hypothetical protein